MEPVQQTMPPDQSESRLRRLKAWSAAMQEQGKKTAEHHRRHHASVDAVFDLYDRDAEVAGGIIAGALAYRLFIWLLPMGLVAVAGLGLAADAESQSPQKTADQLGLLGLVSSSIASASKSSNRYYALLIGIPILFYVTRSVLRVLIGAHRLIWRDLRSASPKPNVVSTLRFLAFVVLLLLAYGLTLVVDRHTDGFVGVIVTILLTLPYAAVWLAVSVRLPHRSAPWQALIPGALLFGLGLEVISAVSKYFIAPYSLAKQGTYGALGTAAVLLLGLFFFSRLIVGAAELNATLWERGVWGPPEQPEQQG